MQDHICAEARTCICGMLDLEPRENCPVHGYGEWPPRCATCGKFMSRKQMTIAEVYGTMEIQ